jgi:hypothetical protein
MFQWVIFGVLNSFFIIGTAQGFSKLSSRLDFMKLKNDERCE